MVGGSNRNIYNSSYWLQLLPNFDIKNKNEVLFSCFNTFVAASYFVLVATIAALVGQHVVRKVIKLVGRASIIIFILALTIFISAISLGIFPSLSFFQFRFSDLCVCVCWGCGAQFPWWIAGGVGIMTMVEKLANNEYMGFDDLCYQS